MKRPKGFMKEALFQKVIDEVRGKTEIISLQQLGESLIHKQLDAFISYAADGSERCRLSTILSTNATLLDKEWSERLLRAGLDFIILCLDGSTPETYEKIRVNAFFNDTLANIKGFLRLKAVLKARTHVTLQMVHMPGNRHEARNLRALFSDCAGVDSYRTKLFHESFAGSNTTVLHRRACYQLWHQMTVQWNGDVPLCCVDYEGVHRMGNVGDNGVDEVFNSDMFWKVRKKSLRLAYNELPFCSCCTIPDMGYFHPLFVLASQLMDARFKRRVIPVVEKFLTS